MANADNQPACPRCARPMVLNRVLPRFAGHPELQTFECRDCREAVTQAVEGG